MKLLWVVILAITLTFSAVTHHESKATTLHGVVTMVNWANPHVTIATEVKNVDGEVETWLQSSRISEYSLTIIYSSSSREGCFIMTSQLPEIHLSNREFFIRRWNQEFLGFLAVIRALPADRLDYRPHPKSRSAGELASLLVSLQHGCIDLCTSQQSAYNTAIRWHPADRPATLEEMVSTYQLHHKALAEKLNRLDDNAWNHPAWMIRGEQEILLKDTIGGLMWLALFDAVHHRGQLSTYIRPMGGKVPSIYGPSADDPGV